MNKNFFNISNAGGIGLIEIFGYIGEDFWSGEGNTTSTISQKLNELEDLAVDSYKVTINSTGGDVNHALAIYNLLRKKGKPVETEMIGMCASSATIIAMAGDKRIISENAIFLIHKCMSAVYGNENELKQELETQKLINDTIVSIYKNVVSNKTDEETIMALMNENNGNGKWISAKEAYDYGFATEIASENKRSNEARKFFCLADIEEARLPKLPKNIADVFPNYSTKHNDGGDNNIVAAIKDLFTDLKNSFMKTKENTVERKFENIALTTTESEDKKCVVDSAELDRIDAEMASTKKAFEDEKTKSASLEKEVADLKELLEKSTLDNAVNGQDPANEPTFSDWAKSQPYYEEVERLTRNY